MQMQLHGSSEKMKTVMSDFNMVENAHKIRLASLKYSTCIPTAVYIMTTF